MRRALLAFPERAPEEKFRVFATNEVGALPLGDGGAGLLDLTGADCPWLGDDPATFWVEGRVHGASASLATEVSLDGAVIGRDAIRIRVAPFLVLSNCDVAEKLFYANPDDGNWDDFEADVTDAPTEIKRSSFPAAFGCSSNAPAAELEALRSEFEKLVPFLNETKSDSFLSEAGNADYSDPRPLSEEPEQDLRSVPTEVFPATGAGNEKGDESP